MDKVFYKKNVPYRIGVRTDIKDTVGSVLDDQNPYIEVEREDLRKFIQANRYAIERGLLIEIDEPPLETVSVNSITDEQAVEIVKNFHALKKRLPEITSDVTILKLLNAAKAGKRSEATIRIITERYEEVSPSAMVNVS